MRSRRANMLASVGMAALAFLATTAASAASPAVSAGYQHVLLISVDGMHAIDLLNMIANHPNSTIAKLASQGIVYPNTFTTAPSDSYPGMLAQVTGGSPKTGGLFYDDSYSYCVTHSAQRAAGVSGRNKDILALREPEYARGEYGVSRSSSACGVGNAAASPLGR